MQFRTQRGNLLTLCERKTRFTLTATLKTKEAAETSTAIIKVLGALPKGARKTMIIAVLVSAAASRSKTGAPSTNARKPLPCAMSSAIGRAT